MEILSAIDKIAFRIGNLEVAWYGIIIVIGMIAGLAIVCLECKRINLELDDAVELFLWVIPLAVIFCRIFYVFARPDVYFPIESWDDFVDVIAIWDGGITIIGGLVGGLIGAGIFAFRKRKKCNFGNIVDLIVVPVLTGQIIGRLGNFVNQEAFGIPITDPRYQTFPFAVWIDQPQGVEPEFRPVVDANTPGWFAATFFYEMVWNLIGAVIFYAIWRKNKRFPGILGFCYFFWFLLVFPGQGVARGAAHRRRPRHAGGVHRRRARRARAGACVCAHMSHPFELPHRQRRGARGRAGDHRAQPFRRRQL